MLASMCETVVVTAETMLILILLKSSKKSYHQSNMITALSLLIDTPLYLIT